MDSGFAAVFAALKRLLAKYENRMAVKADTPVDYTLLTKAPSPFPPVTRAAQKRLPGQEQSACGTSAAVDLGIAAAFLEAESGTAAADHGVDVERGIGHHVLDPWLGRVSLLKSGKGEAGFEHLAQAGDAPVAGVVIGRQSSGLEPALGL